MTTLTTPTIPLPTSDVDARRTAPESHGARRPLAVLGGLCLALGPLLIIGGNLTVPPQASSSDADYLTSLAADPTLTLVSANLYHYGWVALTFGFLAAVGLLRGSRGRVLTLVGGLGGSLGALQMSGLLLSDWFDGAAGRLLPIDQAVAVFASVDASPSMVVWLNSAKVLAIVFPLFLFLGLARAGVISWWVAPLVLGGMLLGPLVAFLVGGGVLGAVLGTVASLVGYLPAFVVAARLVGRGRLTQA